MAGALKVRTDAGTWVTIAGESADGAPGQGVPTGGTTGQVLAKTNATNYNTQWVTPFTQSAADALYLTPATAAGLYLTPATANGLYINIDGDTMTGPLTLAGPPTLPLHAATMAYVDSSVFIPDVFSAANQAAMLALPATRGDYALRSDVSQTFILKTDPATVLANWALLPTPSAAADIAAHVALSDPHTQYALDTDLTSAISAHVGLSDPHTQYLTESAAGTTYLTQASASSTYLTQTAASTTYLTQATAGSTYLPQTTFSAHLSAADPHSVYATDADLSAHVAAVDPHPQYMTQTESDGRYVELLGDTMNGTLTMNGNIVQAATNHKITSRGFKALNGGAGGAPAPQMHFGYAGAENYQHVMETSHDAGGPANSFRFRLWQASDGAANPGTNTVLTLGSAAITSTKPIVLPANPDNPLEAATKQYADLHLTQAEADPLYVNVDGDTMTAGALGFGTRLGQHLNLYGPALYGVGVQGNNLYFRTGVSPAAFRFYSGGVHSDTAAAPGAGGTELLNITNTSVQYKAKNLATELYVQSRGENLVTNGTALTQDNTNFSTFVYEPLETYSGSGSFTYSGADAPREIDEFIPVDPYMRYRFSYAIKLMTKSVGTETPQHYGYVSSYDADRLLIAPYHVYKVAGSTLTTLAAPLNPGNTTITLNNAAGWYNGADTTFIYIAFYPYTNGFGYTYPDYTYTRLTYFDMWAAGGISGNVISLKVPWAGPAYAAGAKVSNNQAAGTYDYVAGINTPTLPNVWTVYTGTIGKWDTDALYTPSTSPVPSHGSYQVSPTGFRHGTAFVKVGWLLSYNTPVGTAKTAIDGVSLDEIQQNAERFAFTAPQGTPPFSVVSTTMVPNLNADLLDGKTANDFLWLTGGSDATNRTINGNVTIPGGFGLSFGSATAQMINLYSTTYALGVQSNTLYNRSASSFYWYKGGTHNNAEANSGGGVELLSLSETLFKYKTNTIWHAGNDGATSGLDADLLDGRDSIDFADREEMEALLGDLMYVGVYDVERYVTAKNRSIPFNAATPNTITGWVVDAPPDASIDFRCDCTIPTTGGSQRPLTGSAFYNQFTGTQFSSLIRATDSTYYPVTSNYPSEIQTVTPSVAPAGVIEAGTFTITLLGVTTGPIQWNATNAAIKTALNTAIPGNTITVAGGPVNTTAFTLTFPNNYGVVPQVVINSSLTSTTDPTKTPTLTPAVTTPQQWLSGVRVQLRATWNPTTDILTHYWRVATGELDDDVIAWNLLGSAPHAGKLLWDTVASQNIGGQATFYYTGSIYRTIAWINGTRSFDMKGSDVPAGVGPPGTATFTPTLGPTLTMVGTGMAQPQVMPQPIWGGGPPGQSKTTYRHGMYWIAVGYNDNIDFVDSDLSGRYDPSRNFNLVSKSLTGNVATITASEAHNIQVPVPPDPDRFILVSGVDATFDGKYKLTAVTANTFSYALTAANVASTPITNIATVTVLFDGPVPVSYGDWIIAIDPDVTANETGTDLALSDMVFQFIPFSTETYVKSQLQLHTDQIASPDPHSQYINQKRGDERYASITHGHDFDIRQSIIDHLDVVPWTVSKWKWDTGNNLTLTVPERSAGVYHNILPGASVELYGFPMTGILADWLTPATGFVTTPDLAVFTINSDVVFTFRVTIPAATAANHYLISQWTAVLGEQTWIIYLEATTRRLVMQVKDSAGVARTAELLSAAEVTSLGTSAVLLGARFQRNVAGSSRFAALQSLDDGVTWTEIGTPKTAAAVATMRDPTTPVSIGARSDSGGERWGGRIYWAKMQTTADPPTGPVVWHWTAAEYPYTGPTWTDPRGHVWTVSNVAAISATVAGLNGNWPVTDVTDTTVRVSMPQPSDKTPGLEYTIPGRMINDPHPQYMSPADGVKVFALKEHTHPYEPLGTVAFHEGKSDPHPGYVTHTEGDAAYARKDHLHDERYAMKDHTHPEIIETHPTDGANASDIWVGSVKPTAVMGVQVGDLWFETPHISLAVPTLPTNFTVGQGTTGSQLIARWEQWAAAEEVDTVDLERSTSPVSGFVDRYTGAVEAGVFIDTLDLTENTEYYYRLRGHNVIGYGPYSPAYYVKTQNDPPPTPATPTVSALAPTSFTLIWTVIAPNTYEVFLNGVSRGFQSSPYPITGLVENTSYTVGVRARDPQDAFSSVVNAASPTTTNASPPAPTGQSISAISHNSATLVWTAVTGIADLKDYEVFLGGTYHATVTTTSYTFTGLTPSTAYTFMVRARDTRNAVSATANAPGTTSVNPDTTPPPAPTLSYFQPVASYGRMEVNFTLTGEAMAYRIDYSVNGGAAVYGTYTAGTGNKVIHIGTWGSGTSIFCRVYSFDAAGNYNWVDSSYALIASPTYIVADGTNSWRNQGGGVYNQAQTFRPYQGYFDNQGLNSIGMWYYGTKPQDQLYNSGRRTITGGAIRLHRMGNCGSNTAADPIFFTHLETTNPGYVTPRAGPGRYDGPHVTAESDLYFGSNIDQALPATWMQMIVNGSRRGICVCSDIPSAYNGKPYICFAALNEDSQSGMLRFDHLG